MCIFPLKESFLHFCFVGCHRRCHPEQEARHSRVNYHLEVRKNKASSRVFKIAKNGEKSHSIKLLGMGNWVRVGGSACKLTDIWSRGSQVWNLEVSCPKHYHMSLPTGWDGSTAGWKNTKTSIKDWLPGPWSNSCLAPFLLENIPASWANFLLDFCPMFFSFSLKTASSIIVAFPPRCIRDPSSRSPTPPLMLSRTPSISRAVMNSWRDVHVNDF